MQGKSTACWIPANPNASPDTQVYLTQTWARPDMVFAHLSTIADANYPAVPDGRPIVDTTNTPYEPSDRINLWWGDYLHASRHGSFLSALVIFATLTGIDPWSFGASEQAASDLGISHGDAVKLQRIASEQLAADGVPLVRIACLHASPKARGAGAGSRSALVCGRGK